MQQKLFLSSISRKKFRDRDETMKKNKNNNTPLVSVVIPVFNGSQYLEETVYSVQNSSYKKLEILLIDDGSGDHSKHICKKLVKKYKNVRFYSFEKNTGLGRVLNFALEKAKGDYICRINQDDRMLKYRIQKQVQFLEKNRDVVAVGSWIRLFDMHNHLEIIRFLEHDEDIKKMWLVVSPFSDPSVTYRKQVAIEVGGYKQEFWPADDTQLWYRMGMAGKLANLQEPLVEVRYHSQAASVKHFRKLAWSTYFMHEWAHNYVESAPFYIRIYWVCQLLSGLILSPYLNWTAYRIIKKIIYGATRLEFFTTNAFLKRKKASTVTAHPKKLSISGA